MTRFKSNPFSTRTWDSYVKRVVIQVTNYLNYDGSPCFGGRSRYVRDLALIVKNAWKKDVLVVQKATRPFSITCPDGIPVLGMQIAPRSYSDPLFTKRVSRLLRNDDGLIYAAGEDAWPFFRSGAKAVQHGIWWDSPQSAVVRTIQNLRALSCVSHVRSVLCVDTNFINWVRMHGARGVRLCNKCEYIPNYADTDEIGIRERPQGGVLKIICARRFEYKRGIMLFVDALRLLKQAGISFEAHVSAVGGVEVVRNRLNEFALSDQVTVSEDSLDRVLERYRNFDVAVVPTIWSEGTSLSCVEAVCAGLPVVATPVGGLGNLIIPGHNGFIARPDAEDIARHLAILANRPVWDELHGNCLRMRGALSRSTWEGRILDWIKK